MIRDFILETANAPGTGLTVNLLGNAVDRKTFASSFNSGDPCFYYLDDNTQAEWGFGIFTAGSPNTITRATVLGNTQGNTNRLNFLGSVMVYNDLCAARAVYIDNSGIYRPLAQVYTSYVNSTGNVDGANFNASGTVAAASVSSPGLIQGGTITTGGTVTAAAVSASGNVSAGSHTGTSVSVTGTVQGGTVTSSGNITATGSVTGANLPTAVYGSVPVMDGGGAVGSSTQWARGDHQHPTDTSRAPASGGNYAPVSGSPNYAPVSGSPNYAPVSGSPNYAPASGSANYLSVNGGTVGSLTVNTTMFANGQVRSNTGRVQSIVANNNPTVSCWDTQLGFAAGICVQAGSSGALYFAGVDGNGFVSAWYGYHNGASVGCQNGTISFTGSGGAFALCYGTGSDFNVPNNAWKPGGGAWASGSDARIKDVLGEYTNGLDAILALRPVRYRYKRNWRHPDDGPNMPLRFEGGKDEQHGPHDHIAEAGTEFIGFVAQEVEGSMPEMVAKIPAVIDGKAVDDLRTVDMTALPLALVNAVKELVARNAALEARLEKLEAAA